jgi:hypothetical protein
MITVKHVEELRINGYTVVESVFTDEEADYCIGIINKVVEEQTGSNDITKVKMPHGVFKGEGVGQNLAGWFARMHPDYRNVMSTLMGIGAQNMITSLDGFSVIVPGTKIRAWPHVDVGNGKNLAGNSFQASISLDEIPVGGATFCCIPGSHRHHTQLLDFCEDDRKRAANFVMMNDAQKEYLDHNCVKAIAVDGIPRGTMIVWDSRLVHWNRGFAPEITEGVRRTMFVTYDEKQAVQQKPEGRKRTCDRDTRWRAFNTWESTTSHWCGRGQFSINAPARVFSAEDREAAKHAREERDAKYITRGGVVLHRGGTEFIGKLEQLYKLLAFGTPCEDESAYSMNREELLQEFIKLSS